MKIIGKLTTNPAIKRYEGNPIISPKDVPYHPAMSYNAGVAKYRGRYVMVIRNDYFQKGSTTCPDDTSTDFGLAYSDDGKKWEIMPKPCLRVHNEWVRRLYDPRLTVIDDRCYLSFAVDTKHGVHVGFAVTDDFEHFEMIGISTPDNRNAVLFPEKINGNYIRLERPFSNYGNWDPQWRVAGNDIWLSESPDLVYWGKSKPVLATDEVSFANLKIGPTASPIKTERGWLTLFHTVDDDPSRGKNGWEPKWTQRYCVGVMFLDLNDPAKILARYEEPLMVPEAPYETGGGYRHNVIFPGGLILEDDGEVKIYYGASDTVECLATTRLEDLIRLCFK